MAVSEQVPGPMGHDRGGRRHVLRLTSVFEVSVVDGEAGRFDPIGGMQNHTAALSRCLDESGVEQTIVTSRLGGRTGTTALGRHARIVRVGLRIRHLRQLWALCALPYVLRPRRRVDVVHAHQGEDMATLLLAQLAARVHRCPLVVTVHMSVRHTMRGRSPRALALHLVGGRIERAALREAAAVIVLAERTARLVRDDGVLAARVRTIPSGFEPALFAGTSTDPFPDVERPRIGYVGRLAPQKCPELVVAAFDRIRTRASLVIVGDGPSAAHVEEAITRSPARERITVRGFVPHPQVPAVLRALDVLVLPAAYEELGSVLVEAMAAGLPVVATRVGGIPEVVRDGESGLLVPPGDLDALAGAIERILGDPALAARLGTCGRARAGDYAWPSLARRVAAVYDEVLGVTTS